MNLINERERWFSLERTLLDRKTVEIKFEGVVEGVAEDKQRALDD